MALIINPKTTSATVNTGRTGAARRLTRPNTKPAVAWPVGQRPRRVRVSGWHQGNRRLLVPRHVVEVVADRFAGVVVGRLGREGDVAGVATLRERFTEPRYASGL